MGKIRVRHGDNEIELDGSDAFIKKQLEEFYARVGASSPSTPTPKPKVRDQLLSGTPEEKPKGKQPTPAEFYKAKGKTDGISQVLVFGRYLEEFRGKAEFTRKEINAVAAEARLSKDIHAQFFTRAVEQGLLRRQGQKYSLTLTAEELLAGK